MAHQPHRHREFHTSSAHYSLLYPLTDTPRQSKYSSIKDIPQRSISSNTTSKAAPPKPEDAKPNGADLPAIRSSTIDINAIPIHKGTGKPITQVNIDEDLPENDKPWRKPGTDLSDYFNYGFDEFTWALYSNKQEQLRGEYNSDSIANNQKKMFEDMNSMMMMAAGMPGMPTMPGMAAGGAGAGAGSSGGAAGGGMPGMDGMPPEMQQMMQQMMAAGGMDPSQMDPAAMGAMFAGMQNPGGAAGQGQGGPGQNFGGGFGGNQGQGFGYDQGNMGGGNRGGFGGPRGRGGRQRY